MEWVLGEVSLGMKWPEHETDDSPPTNAKVTNGGAVPSLPYTSSGDGA
jgi:hypothetical protein